MSDPPRVLHLDDGRGWRGGQQQVYLLMRGLAARGIPQLLAAREGEPLAQRARAAGLDVVHEPFGGELDPRAPGRIAKIAAAFTATILHAHTSHAHALGLRAVRRLDAPSRLVTTRRVDFPINGFFSRRKYRDPAQHYIAISQKVREILIDAGVDPARIDLVHSGVPPFAPGEAWSRHRAREALGIADSEIAIGNVGALTDHKGQAFLIGAAPAIFSALPGARIHILGEGDLRPELESQIERLDLEKKVILHGFVDDARAKLAAFDLFVSSSHLEGLGTIILDAMQTSVPVVAARAGGVPEIVLDRQTGRLCPPRDPNALALAVIAALENPAPTAEYAAAARDHVARHFSADAMAAGTLAVYHKLQ